jgi:hypothetical protein
MHTFIISVLLVVCVLMHTCVRYISNVLMHTCVRYISNVLMHTCVRYISNVLMHTCVRQWCMHMHAHSDARAWRY